VLQTVLKRPNFQLDRDLDALLQEFNKPTELPEIASVPLHLDNLFQAAVAEVDKTKSKSIKEDRCRLSKVIIPEFLQLTPGVELNLADRGSLFYEAAIALLHFQHHQWLT